MSEVKECAHCHNLRVRGDLYHAFFQRLYIIPDRKFERVWVVSQSIRVRTKICH